MVVPSPVRGAMSLLSREDLERLLVEDDGGPHVSIYLPTHRTGLDHLQDPIRLKNALHEAEEALRGGALRPAAIDELLAPGRELLADERFWKHQGDGLAVLLAPGRAHVYRLPLMVDPAVLVADRFHVRRLLPVVGEGGRFWILALARNSVRLFEATRDKLRPIDLMDIPHRLQDVVGYDWEEQSLQFRSGVAGSGGSVRPGMYHGHGEGADDDKAEVARFFRVVDRGIAPLLADERAPLVVAAVRYEIDIFRRVTHYAHVLEHGVEGSPEATPPAELHVAAWRLVEPVLAEKRDRAAAAFDAFVGTGRASADLGEILGHALEGRVWILFVATDETLWGTYDAAGRRLQAQPKREPGDRDLLELVAAECLVRGAEIHAVPRSQVPGGGHVAAINRF